MSEKDSGANNSGIDSDLKLKVAFPLVPPSAMCWEGRENFNTRSFYTISVTSQMGLTSLF